MFNVIHQVWYLFLLVFAYGTYAGAEPSKWVESLPSFVDEKAYLLPVVVENNTGDVFVGGRNVLYHFSSDLKLKQKVATGPVKDYAGCFIPPYYCSTARTDTNNLVQILKIVDFLGDTPYILLCGTVYNRLCQVRPINNLEEYHWVEPYNETLGYATNSNGMSDALFHRGLDGQTSMIMATQDDYELRNSKYVPYLSSKILKKDGDRFYFQYTYQSSRVSSQVAFKSASSRWLYDVGFEYGGFIYFPVVYFKETTVLFVVKRQELENKLVRFCANDTTFRSYAELPIICKYEDKVMTKLQGAHIGPSKKGPGKMDLYTSFTDDKETGSALCVFPMQEIEKAFTTYPRRCNDDIVGETCGRPMTQISDFCGPEVRPYICTSTCMVKHFVYLPVICITSISVVKQGDELVAIVGPKGGELIKISMSTGDIISRKLILKVRDLYTKPFTFDQEKRHIYLQIKNKVIKYPVASCHVHETCQECFTQGKKDPLGCGWCSDGKCAHKEECAHPETLSNDTCTPVAYSSNVIRTPIQGGNNFQIFGDNFGSYVDAEHNSVFVAGVPCTPTFWNNTVVNCTSGSTPKELSGPLTLFSTNNYSSSLGYGIGGSFTSKKNFIYFVGPRLYGIRPSKGPTSGGTQVRLYGQNLDYDKEKKRLVSVHGRFCNLKEYDANTITCVTSWRTMNPEGTIALHIDDTLYVLDRHPPPEFNTSGLSQTFEFAPDPFITNIQPGYTTVSGAVNLTASGKHFDSVQFPKLVMKIDENQIVGKTEFIEDCWTDPQSNGTVMTCRTPSIKDRLVYPTRTQPLLAQVSFLMDGVQALKDFPKHHRDLSRLLYYPDPEFTVFHGTEKIKKDQKMLQIKGDNLDLMHSKEKLKVKIGKNESCDITRVSSDALFCNLASSIFSSNSSLDEEKLSVEVLSGSTTHHLGYIELVQQKDPQDDLRIPLDDLRIPHEESDKEGTKLWIIIAVVVVICCCVSLVAYIFCWRRGRKPFKTRLQSAAVNNDYRRVPARTFVRRNVQDEQDEVPVHAASRTSAHEVPINAASMISAHKVPVNAASRTSAYANQMFNVNTVPKIVSINAAPPMAPVTEALPMVPVNVSPGVPGDRATATSSLVDKISPFLDEETLICVEKFAEKNLIISKNYLTISEVRLGSGEFGFVYKGLLHHPNEIEPTTVAIKMLRQHTWADPLNNKLFLEEAVIMLDIDHTNIVCLQGVCLDDRGPLIVLPFMCNGSLLTYMRNEDIKLIPLSDLLKFAVDVAAGMQYLENIKALHRDLAARNILLDQDQTAKVSDFGLSRDIYSEEYYIQGSRTKIPIKWTAPEAIKDKKYSSKSDVWAYGVLLWEIMTRGADPYEEVPNFDMLEFLSIGRRLLKPVRCPWSIYDVMLACWNLDSKLRPSFNTLLKYMRFLHQDLLRAQQQPEPVYVPAKHSVYDDSKEYYLSMEGKRLRFETDSD